MPWQVISVETRGAWATPVGGACGQSLRIHRDWLANYRGESRTRVPQFTGRLHDPSRDTHAPGAAFQQVSEFRRLTDK